MNHEGHEDHKAIPAETEQLALSVVDLGLRVHRTLGPGLLESAYEHCLAYELRQNGIPFRRQAALPITYGSTTLDAGYRLDLVIGEAIIVEVKAVDELTRLHAAQLLTYLRLSGLRVGFLMNFNVGLFKQGLRRLVL